MTDRARQLLEEIRDELRAQRKLEEARRVADDGTPLSRAEFCRVLGIDLKCTLVPLIKAGKIKAVPWTRGESRIPVSELRRLQRDGIPALVEPPPHRGRAANSDSAEDEADAIGAIKVR